MQLNGSEIIMECLLEQGVDTVFGYPGGTILNIYDALYQYSDKITHILTSHEQGASHAADGYARSTGKVGVCMATSGPGATNLVTGIATAYMDSIPMVAITANVAKPLLGKDTFQEIDIAGVTMPITKHNFIVKDVNDIAKTLRRAFYIAKSGRPGPVLVDITKDATDPKSKADYEYKEPKLIERIVDTIKESDIESAVKLINESKKPYIFVGGGVIASDASEELAKLVEITDAPVCDTLMGKGAFNGEDEHYTGMIGMHGTKTANFGVSDRVTGNTSTFAKKAKILHIDIEAAEINKNIKTTASVIGDAKVILSRINEKLDKIDRSEWIEKIKNFKAKYPLKYDTTGLTGPYVIEKIYEVTKGDAIITTEVGQHQMWAAQFCKYKKPRTLITSGGLGTMGYGLGASLGAKIGMPDKTVINIAGDGCFRMNMNEIATATRYNIPIVQVVINNHVLGMVRQWQTLFYGKRYSNTILNDSVDFVKLAEAMGAKAYRVTKKEELESVLVEAINLGCPVVIDCQIDSDDKVFPMVAPGGAISEAFSQEDLDVKE